MRWSMRFTDAEVTCDRQGKSSDQRSRRRRTGVTCLAMCTAYQIGKRGGSFPQQVKAQAIKTLLELKDRAIICPTLPAPVSACRRCWH